VALRTRGRAPPAGTPPAWTPSTPGAFGPPQPPAPSAKPISEADPFFDEHKCSLLHSVLRLCVKVSEQALENRPRQIMIKAITHFRRSVVPSPIPC
jgi:hypothetical protein